MFGMKESGFAVAGSSGEVVIADAMVQPLRSAPLPEQHNDGRPFDPYAMNHLQPHC